jgi:uncharacterized membrane protein
LNSEDRFDRAIGYVLITGVVISLLVEAIGMVLYHLSYGHFNISGERTLFIHGRNFFDFTIELFKGDYAGKKAVFLMSLGVVILVLTPYVRVLMSVLYFAWEKNTKYILITLFVLVLLTISLAAQ